MSILKVLNLEKGFIVAGQSIQVLTNISFDVKEGQIAAILGRSGSGKSTLLNLLGCLDTPTAGTYWLNGQEVGRSLPEELAQIRCQKIGFVFQKFNLINSLTVLENVILPQLYLKIPRDKASSRAKELLKMVGLEQREQFMPFQLSGGQQQRVCIARALANRPAIILADEPTGSLDAENGQKIIELFFWLRSELKITIILVTHDLGLAGLADRIFELNAGFLAEKSNYLPNN